MDALKEIEQTREEMKKLPKEMQALLIIQKYLDPNYNKEAWLILCHCIASYSKKSEALDILGEKETIDIDMIKTCKTVEEYNRQWQSSETKSYKKKHLWFTQEQFDLLKEVLK